MGHAHGGIEVEVDDLFKHLGGVLVGSADHAGGLDQDVQARQRLNEALRGLCITQIHLDAAQAAHILGLPGR